MKLLRKLIAIFVLLIIVFVFIVVSLGLFVDPNKLKPVITEEVMKRTGYRLNIDGGLSWSFYPIIGVKITHMTLTGPNQSTAFLDLKGVNIATEFWQLIQGKGKLQGDLYISKIKLLNINAENARVKLNWQNNVLTLQPFTASLYNGSLEAYAEGRGLATVPRWSWDIKIKNIQMASLLNDVNGADSKIKLSGRGNLNLRISTQGKTKDQIINNLNGTTDFSLNDGIVEGIDLNYLVASADALISKKPLPTPTNLNQTEFASLTGVAIIKNGIAKTDNLLLSSTAFKTDGVGSIDLVNQRLDMRLLVTPLNTTKLKWPVPVLVEGDLRSPSVRLDMLTLKTLITKEQVEKVKAKVQEQIKELPEKANKFLQKFLEQ